MKTQDSAKFKNRTGWPKKSTRVEEDGSQTEVEDFGIMIHTSKKTPQKLSSTQPNGTEDLKKLVAEVTRRLEAGEHFPDQRRVLKRLLIDMEIALSSISDGDAEDAASRCLRIGIAVEQVSFDWLYREFVQSKRNELDAVRRPRPARRSAAWKAVERSHVKGQTWQSAMKVYIEAGGEADPESFRKGFRERFKKSDAKP